MAGAFLPARPARIPSEPRLTRFGILEIDGMSETGQGRWPTAANALRFQRNFVPIMQQ